MITDVNTARTKFMNAASDPQAAGAHAQAVTDAIANEFKNLRSVVTDIRDMAKALPAANAGLAKEVDETFELNKSGVHHVEARIVFKDANTGVLLKHVKFTLSQGGTVIETSHSTPRGLVQVKDKDNGNYMGTAELPNYQKSVVNNIGIESGKILDLVVLLTVNP
jgi:NAD-specific glutamate dehydrogenase